MTRAVRTWCLRRPYQLIKLIVVVNVVGLLMCVLTTTHNYRATPMPPLATSSIRESLASLDRSSRPQRPIGTGQDVGDEVIADIARSQVDMRTPLTILVWNSKNDRWNFKVDLRPFGDVASAGRRQCVYTTDKAWYNASAGVLFYGDLMHLSKFPTGRRPHGQKWIYLSVETPVNTIHTGIKQLRLQRQKHVYNVTSTYSMTSDVPLPYFSETCRVDRSLVDGEKTRSEIRSAIGAKRHLVAWFVSHCETSSRREKYVEELRKYVDVDIYGRCGSLNCSRVLANHTDNYYTACDDMVTHLYKFYLAFENSLCQDYVTEKFFRFLRRDIVTIALGAGNYSKFVPRDTYIDVRDFRSPKDLAMFLKALDSTDKTYEEYLVRKRNLRCQQLWLESHPERLCRHLWDNANATRRADLSSSLNAHKVCSTPRVFYRGVADTISH